MSDDAGLSAQEVQRYARHLLIPQVGSAGQRALTRARVLCIGAGGLGSPALQYLAAAGVGTVGVVDFDEVDVSNLHRQLLFRDTDRGRPKVEVAAEALGSINPLIDVRTHPQRLTGAGATELFAEYDVVVDGSDNFATRYVVNDAALAAGVPDVWASVLRFDAQVAVFGGSGPCYRCLYPQAPHQGAVPSCAEAGVLGVLCGMVGSIQATEAIKIILGIGQTLSGRLLTVDALSMDLVSLPVQRRPDCAACGPDGDPVALLRAEQIEQIEQIEQDATRAADTSVPQISPAQLQQLRGQDEELVVLDVREVGERAICHIDGSVHIPMDRVAAAVDAGTLSPTDHIVVHCKSGARAARVTQDLLQRSFTDVRNLRGGILAWRDEIDPSLPHY